MITPHVVIDIPDEMHDEIQFEVDAPHSSIVNALRRSVIKFCEKSHYWQEECEPITVVAGTQTYDLEFSDESKQIVSVMHVADDEEIKYERCETGEVSRGYWQGTPTTIDIYPDDELGDRVITVIAAIRPALFENEFKVSKPLIADYRDAIVAGAKALLYVIPNKPWMNLQLAQINQSTFDAIAEDALLTQARGYSRVHGKAPRKVREYY